LSTYRAFLGKGATKQIDNICGPDGQDHCQIVIREQSSVGLTGAFSEWIGYDLAIDRYSQKIYFRGGKK
jgi:hypothetical protein